MAAATTIATDGRGNSTLKAKILLPRLSPISHHHSIARMSYQPGLSLQIGKSHPGRMRLRSAPTREEQVPQNKDESKISRLRNFYKNPKRITIIKDFSQKLYTAPNGKMEIQIKAKGTSPP